MTTKTSKGRLVEFFATSSRLARAARSAAKRNKSLARYSAIHEVGHAVPLSEARGIQNLHVVMLSHADEDHLVLTDAGMEAMVSEAFHLLFTEPATHPDQVAQWIRRTNIRSEHRLHIARVDDLDAPQVSELLGRICHAFGPERNRGSIVDAYLGGNFLSVRGPKQRLLHVPVASIPALRNLPRAVLRDFRIDPDGSFVHWPSPDIHLGWNQFLQAADPLELHKAQQRSADFNRRYGAAIRKLREEAGIPQAKVKGITERQLRRIEQGECRATANALQDMANAHGLDVNTYMEKVANAIS
jgi:Helix-turn-helix domain